VVTCISPNPLLSFLQIFHVNLNPVYTQLALKQNLERLKLLIVTDSAELIFFGAQRRLINLGSIPGIYRKSTKNNNNPKKGISLYKKNKNK